jgi:hypothetical protein
MVASESTSKRGSDWRIVSVGGKDSPDRPTVQSQSDGMTIMRYQGMLYRLGLPPAPESEIDV